MNTVYVSNGYTVSVFNNKMQFIKCFEAKHKLYISSSWFLVGIAVDYTGNLLHAFPDCGTVAIF